MKLSLVAATTAAALVGSALAFGQNPAAPATAPAAPAQGGSEFKDLKSKVSYGLGLNMGKNFKAQSIDLDPDLVAKGLKDGIAGKAVLSDAEIGEAMKAFQQDLQSKAMDNAKKQADNNKKEGVAFLAANSKKPGVRTLPSGLQYKVEKEGAGASPKPSDVVTVDYEGRLIDGTVFDSSYKRGEPASFPVNGVIKGWTEALQLMKVGSKWQIYIPADLAYGESPRPGGPIPPNATLVFDVELKAIGGAK